MRIAQITDCHIVDEGALMADRVDSADRLTHVVDVVNAFRPAVDLVLLTGDLVNDGTSSQYDRLDTILGRLHPPAVPVMGNHDDRSELRARHPDVLPAGTPADPIDFTVDEHPLRIVVLDTTIPGEHRGMLSDDQLSWLDDTLADRPDHPTIIAQHHPPFRTGLERMDAYGLTGSAEEAAVVQRHPHVEAVVCGHLHRTIHTRFGGTVASCWPATAAQLHLGLDDGPVAYTDAPPAFALHDWDARSGLRSHAVEVGGHDRWIPSWSEHVPVV
ncbi:MAG: phosphodiesterase [Ilumatobacter sp.]|uniref:phosphodiesterase n=1 Tax=Ilumatobacter sp. TaxID=1967498 RepID=UPI00261542E9|nr:phosphodiesterase [Ilumatobacter sp.]MDJ0767292.1 phosphodiesterase [Ilumatobacter sp.]